MKTFATRAEFLKGVRKENLRIVLSWGEENPLDHIFAYDQNHGLKGYYADEHGDIAETPGELARLQAIIDHPEK